MKVLLRKLCKLEQSGYCIVNNISVGCKSADSNTESEKTSLSCFCRLSPPCLVSLGGVVGLLLKFSGVCPWAGLPCSPCRKSSLCTTKVQKASWNMATLKRHSSHFKQSEEETIWRSAASILNKSMNYELKVRKGLMDENPVELLFSIHIFNSFTIMINHNYWWGQSTD